jgi:hypothetical protein
MKEEHRERVVVAAVERQHLPQIDVAEVVRRK